MNTKKVILAYSGGLDTSVILKWLCNKGYDVICYVANVGQQESFGAIKEKALMLGAQKVYIEDLQHEFINNFVFQALKANAKYEGQYLLGTALARPLIAKRQIEIAKKEKTNLVAHGATAKGNDQIRFELTYYSLMPEVHIISPWKDLSFVEEFQGRNDLIEYAQKHDIPITSCKEKPYSIDENCMHVSYEGGLLEDIAQRPPNLNLEKKLVNGKEKKISITFIEGIPVCINNHTDQQTITEPLEIFSYLNQLGKEYNIGIYDIVESRMIGMKSRGIYQAPAASILYAAHRDLESIALDQEVILLKDMLMPKIAQLIYFGFWFSPEMNFLMAAVNQSQERVTGTVHGVLKPNKFCITGREAKTSLYDQQLASMDELKNYSIQDVHGFIKINSMRLKKYMSSQ